MNHDEGRGFQRGGIRIGAQPLQNTGDDSVVFRLINAIILSVGFLTLFMGTTLLCAILIVSWFLGWISRDGLMVVGGSLSLIVGMVGATMAFNVPMNDAGTCSDES